MLTNREKAIVKSSYAAVGRKFKDQLGGVKSELEKYIYNMLTLEEPFVLPRAVPTHVAPHLFAFANKISPPQGVLAGAVVVRPSPDAFLDISQDVAITATPYKNEVSIDFNLQLNTELITLDTTQVFVNGHVKCSTAPPPAVGFHISESNKGLKPGLKYYPGNFTFTAADLLFKLKNPGNTDLVGQVELGFVTPAGAYVQSALSAATTFTAGASTTVTFLAANALYLGWRTVVADPNTSRGYVIGIRFSTPVKVTSGLVLTVSGPNISSGSQTIWKRLTLWDVIANSAVSKAQYDYADRYAVTGLIATFSNLSNFMAKGGVIYAARFPGDSFHRLPGDIPNLVSLITSQKHDVLRQTDIETGASWSFVPEKLQDWLFQEKEDVDPYNGNPLNMPYFVLVWDASVAQNSVPVFNLHGRIMLEYLTTDPSNEFRISHADANFADALLHQMCQLNTVTENPNHLENLLGYAKEIVASPEMTDLYKQSFGRAARTLLGKANSMIDLL